MLLLIVKLILGDRALGQIFLFVGLQSKLVRKDQESVNQVPPPPSVIFRKEEKKILK